MIRTQILAGAIIIAVGIVLSITLPSEGMAVVSTCLGLVGGSVMADGFVNWDMRS